MEPSDKQGQNILIHIRNDEIEVAEDKIRLNENVLLAQEITGIRCSEISKCIEVKAGNSKAIKIECKRMFRNQDQVRNDFQCIVAVIKRLLVPKIARNIANQVLGGKTFDLSPFCKFTQQGICITRVKLQGTRSRELKTNVESRPSRPTSESFVVSYIDLELRAENRFLEIGPKGNPKGFYTQISRDDWNAEIIEGIAKNIFTPTTNNPQSNKDVEAIYERGVKCLYEEIKDYAQAALFFKEAAELDHAKAQFMLGNLYLHGQGVVKNENEAVKWFHKAADKGDPGNQTVLGGCYEDGTGVQKNASEAVNWYRKAADQGDSNGQCLLGGCYENGIGVPINVAEAVKWYCKAADQGGFGGYARLGRCYRMGIGVPKDVCEAYKFFKLAVGIGKKSLADLVGKMSPVEVEEGERRFREHRSGGSVPDVQTAVPAQKEIVESKISNEIVVESTHFRDSSGNPHSNSIEDYSIQLFQLALEGADGIRKLSENRSVEQSKYGLVTEFFPVFNVFHNLYLHITDREAFLAFGPAGRNEIMKPLVFRSIDHAVNTLFDTIYEDVPRDKLPRIKKDCVEHLSWSNETYGQYKKLSAEPGASIEGTILWRFGIEVAEQAGRPGNEIYMAQSREQALNGIAALDAKSYVRQFLRGG